MPPPIVRMSVTRVYNKRQRGLLISSTRMANMWFGA